MRLRNIMPRPRIFGFILILTALSMCIVSLYSIVSFLWMTNVDAPFDLTQLSVVTYIVIATPISLVSFFVICTGFWIGWTILNIKVVPPMPDIVDKKDYSKFKAVILCFAMLSFFVLLFYGLIVKSFWALAIPAAIISFVILGAIFWVGLAIITTRSTLHGK